MMADFAKEQKDRDLEAAALERTLELDPTDKAIRFRIAYLYGEWSKNGLEIHHYRLRLAQGPESASLNNLAISLGQVECPAEEIDCLTEATANTPMARANLSHAYIDRGFLKTGEPIAREAAKSAAEIADNNAQMRATAAIDRIVKQRADEKDREAKVVAEAKEEAGFRSRYAQAFMDSPHDGLLEGTFELPDGRISLVQEGKSLRGELERNSSEATTSSTETKSFIVGTLKGQAANFEIRRAKTDSAALSILLSPETSKGFVIVSAEGRSIEFAREAGKKLLICSARKVQALQG
jgi:hypothetical protein